jgi:hypothetical protein
MLLAAKWELSKQATRNTYYDIYTCTHVAIARCLEIKCVVTCALGAVTRRQSRCSWLTLPYGQPT